MNQNRLRALPVSVVAAAAFALGVCGLTHGQGEGVSALRPAFEQSATGGSVVVIAAAEPKQWMW
ncbi:hypothetical protein ACIODT_07335 [Streptomyces sp. NPDC088251]|uniref:hypothetical protein n=1 Tax=unclassified Streptomyces TaxID=2593676 RepID=UPI00381FD044